MQSHRANRALGWNAFGLSALEQPALAGLALSIARREPPKRENVNRTRQAGLFLRFAFQVTQDRLG